MWWNLHALERLFLVEVDLEELGNDLKEHKVNDQEWFSVVESFIESFDQEKEVVHLLGVSQIHVENPDEKQCFTKSFFRFTDENTFEKISKKRFITKQEYYERLIHQTGEAVGSKIRLSFTLEGLRYDFDFTKESRLTILRIEVPSDDVDKSTEEIFGKLKAVQVTNEYPLTVEELSYRLYKNELIST
jgi:hypothetical protein